MYIQLTPPWVVVMSYILYVYSSHLDEDLGHAMVYDGWPWKRCC